MSLKLDVWQRQGNCRLTIDNAVLANQNNLGVTLPNTLLFQSETYFLQKCFSNYLNLIWGCLKDFYIF